MVATSDLGEGISACATWGTRSRLPSTDPPPSGGCAPSPCEVAFFDLGLPVMNGFELARSICAEWGERRPRLVALTGYGQERDRERSRAAGFDAHLVKPAELSVIAAELEHLVSPAS